MNRGLLPVLLGASILLAACVTGPAPSPPAESTLAPAASPSDAPSPSPTPTAAPTTPAPLPSATPDPIAAYRDATIPELNHLYDLGAAVQGQCPGAATAACRAAFQSLFDASAAATTDFEQRPYPPCLVGLRTSLRATAVGYHNAAIQGLGAIDSNLLYSYQPGLNTIADEEHVIKQTALFDTPPDCYS